MLAREHGMPIDTSLRPRMAASCSTTRRRSRARRSTSASTPRRYTCPSYEILGLIDGWSL
jgi:hypothetical protein